MSRFAFAVSTTDFSRACARSASALASCAFACCSCASYSRLSRVKSDLPLLHHRAFLVMLRLQKRLDAGPDLHRVVGVGAGRQLHVDRHRLLLHLRDNHRDGCPGRRRGARLGLLFAMLRTRARRQSAATATGDCQSCIGLRVGDLKVFSFSGSCPEDVVPRLETRSTTQSAFVTSGVRKD